jgi:hypothetical protein
MAIQKTKTMSNGAVGNYWRIMSINIDRQNLRIAGKIALFKDQAASVAGSPPLGEQKTFRFSFTMVEFLSADNAVAFAYNKIKTLAAVEITHDLAGNVLDTPRVADSDLVGGIDVL